VTRLARISSFLGEHNLTHGSDAERVLSHDHALLLTVPCTPAASVPPYRSYSAPGHDRCDKWRHAAAFGRRHPARVSHVTM